jgi:hypothetical protein
MKKKAEKDDEGMLEGCDEREKLELQQRRKF